MNHATTLAIVDKIIANLCSRRGFYQAFDIDEDIMEELREDLACIVSQKWLPIETAPKDGSFVLVYADGFSIHEGSWCEHHESFCDCEGYTMWWATHWMNVPDVPHGTKG